MTKEVAKKMKEVNVKTFFQNYVPYILGLYFVLFSANQMQLYVTGGDFALSFLTVSAFILGIHGLHRFIFKDKLKAIVLTTFLVFFLLFYFKISEMMSSQPMLRPYARHRFMIPVLFLFLSYFYLLKKEFRNVAQYLSFTVPLLLVMELFNGANVYFSKSELTKSLISEAKADTEVVKFTNKQRPNIYYLLFDGYTGFEGMEKHWKFDNSPFKKELERRDFTVMSNARTVYNNTLNSMYANFEMDFIPRVEELYYRHSAMNVFVQRELTAESKLFRTLLANEYELHNYSFINLPGKEAFYSFDLIPQTPSLFSYIVQDNFLGLFARLKHSDRIYKSHQDLFAVIGNLPKEIKSSGQFTYAHYVLPHPPYMYHADGRLKPNKLLPEPEDYLDQVAYTNKVILEVVDDLVKNSAEPPVIIVQSDHGSGQSGLEKSAHEDEHQSIITAFYFPEKMELQEMETFSSINTFRIMMNQVFDTNMPLHPHQENHYKPIAEFKQ